jgi:DNA polymerase-3 subunit chi
VIEVEFHHNAPDRTQAVCRLIADRASRGEAVFVFAPDEAAAQVIDTALWTFDALSFVPHCMAGSPLAANTPVVIGSAPARGAAVWVNYSNVIPPDDARFAILVEVVGQDSADREAARQRFRHYRERGFTLTTHDLCEAKSIG